MVIIKEPALPIIISGTGPAALLFAHALLKSEIPVPFKLYERDPSMTYRGQGYRFRVTGRGVSACQDILSPQHFALLRATCGEGPGRAPQFIDPVSGNSMRGKGPKFQHKGGPEPLTADRTFMRQVLFKGLEPYTTFGKAVVGFENTKRETALTDDSSLDKDVEEAGVVVRFADGTAERAALLVGADGAYSRIRAQLQPRVKLLDTEMRMIFGRSPLTPAFRQALDECKHEPSRITDVLKGMSLVADPAPQESPRFFMCDAMHFGQRDAAVEKDPVLGRSLPKDYMYWALALRKDRSEVKGIDWRSMSTPSAADFAVNLTRTWAPWLQTLVANQDRKETLPLLSAITPLPLQDWRAEPVASRQHNDKLQNQMVTLIGDSAHAMPPTGGLGATTALTDAAVLGAALAEHGFSHHALRAYESEMRGYASDAIQKSLDGGKTFINMRGQGELQAMER